MGHTCTLPTRTKVDSPFPSNPKSLKSLKHHQLFIRKCTTSATASTTTTILDQLSIDRHGPSISLSQISRQRSTVVEPKASIDISEEPRSRPITPPLEIKYDLRELGIGEHYLATEFSEVKVRKFRLLKKVESSRKKKEANWDTLIVQVRDKIAKPPQIDNSLYNQIDQCIREIAIKKPKLYTKMLKDGPPMRYRWASWKNIIDIDRFYETKLYEKLKKLSSKCEYDIYKDIHRTFPFETYFCSKKHDTIGQTQLFNVLKAISLYFPNIEYVQGMNFLIGFLLILSGGNELEAFWAFITLARDPRYMMMGFFEKDFPLLEFYLYAFYKILEEQMPEMYSHLKHHSLPDQMWVFKWFLTVFVHSVKPAHAVRIWDFVINGSFLGLIQVAIAILKFFETDLIQLDVVGLDQFFRHLKGEEKKNKRQKHGIKSEAETPNHAGTHQNTQQSHTPKHVNASRHSPEIEGCGSICHETSEFCYTFKDVDIEEIIRLAEKTPISLERIERIAQEFLEEKHKKIPEVYTMFLRNLGGIFTDWRKQVEFQEEIDYHMMKTQLVEKRNSEIVVSNLLVENESENILLKLAL